jgi:hypothetical protein
MAIQQGALANQQAARFGIHLGAYVGGIIFKTAVKAPAGFALQALIGRPAGPRGYKREKFPEAQWHQIVAGKRDWFS